jgi:5-methylthioadenosine/S-adenosylhomocysteine deaminase
MTLLKGAGEDMELDRWLKEKIWPMEARMSVDHLRAGMALACLEMIRTGTTLFNDMYFNQGDVADIVHNSGLRAILGEGFIDLFDEERREEAIRKTRKSMDMIEGLSSPRISNSLSPHAIYTVSRDGLEWCHQQAMEKDLTLHIHISETEMEVKNSQSNFGGTPVEVLDNIGILDGRMVGAHCVHLSDRDLNLIKRSGMHPVHLPTSNMKLSVGGQLRYPDISERNISTLLGTDGSASNNSLDMFSSMKMMGLLCKQSFGASSISSSEIISSATEFGYRGLGFNGGLLEEGSLADLILIDIKDPSMVPLHDLASNVVYSLDSRAVRYNMVDGRIIMDNGNIEGQDIVVKEALYSSKELLE